MFNFQKKTLRNTRLTPYACNVKSETFFYFSVEVSFSDLLVCSSSPHELNRHEGVTLRLRVFVEPPDRGGRATRRGLAVILNSSEKASCITFVSVFSRIDSTKLLNSGTLKRKIINVLHVFNRQNYVEINY